LFGRRGEGGASCYKKKKGQKKKSTSTLCRRGGRRRKLARLGFKRDQEDKKESAKEKVHPLKKRSQKGRFRLSQEGEKEGGDVKTNPKLKGDPGKRTQEGRRTFEVHVSGQKKPVVE